jgi:hypothetical protein
MGTTVCGLELDDSRLDRYRQFRHCERSEAIQDRVRRFGLLRRFASRNDDSIRLILNSSRSSLVRLTLNIGHPSSLLDRRERATGDKNVQRDLCFLRSRQTRSDVLANPIAGTI